MVQFLLVVGLLVVCSIGPGLFFVRRLSWSPLEKLCSALGLSFIFLYAVSFLIYSLGLPHVAHFIVSAVCLVLLVLSGRDLVRLWRRPAVRRACQAFAFLFVGGLLLLALVRHYSGGLWTFDWQEHYERSVFFLEGGPRDVRFLDLYPLPARPPFMNVVAAHFLSLSGAPFWVFQVACLFLNLLVFFPLCLMLRVFARRGGRNLTLLVGLLLANPMLWQNATFTWTKLLTAFYVVMGVWFYLAGWRKNDPVRMAVAFLSLAAGILVHFSAGPFALFLALHYLAFVFPRRAGRWWELLGVVVPGALLLATWFGWSLAVYGVGTTFGSNTTAAELADATAGDTFLKVARNVFWSLVPHPLRQPPSAFDADFIQPDRLGYLRDYTFLIYQTNYLFAMGSVGGPLVVWLLVRVWRDRSEVGRAERRFWLMFVPFTALVGIAAHPTPDPYGVAHICGQPLVLLGVTFLAARFLTLPPVARWLGLAGCALDFVLGVLLHFSLQNRVFKFTLTEEHLHIPPSPAHLSTRAVLNAVARQVGNFVFLGDSFVGLSGLITAVLVLTFLVVLGRMAGFLSRPAPHRPPPGARLPEYSKDLPMRLIYHIVSRQLWERTTDAYQADSLQSEGFIHCSNEGQVAQAANRFYASATDLLVLVIDAGRLTASLRDEEASTGERFPHVYGPINGAAVIEARPLRRGTSGEWVFP